GDADGKTGVDETVGTQRDHADAVAGERGLADSGSTETPSSETSSGPVAVAAAIGIALSTVTARTDSTAAVSSIQAGTSVTLVSALNADVASGADGSATSPDGSAGIGAGVALSYAKHVNAATVPATLTVRAHDLVISATVAADGADDTATITAAAASGAAG